MGPTNACIVKVSEKYGSQRIIMGSGSQLYRTYQCGGSGVMVKAEVGGLVITVPQGSGVRFPSQLLQYS